MHLFYISPSVLPSRSANSVHVVQQCEAFNRIGVAITLFGKRSIADRRKAFEAIRCNYGVKLQNTRLISFYNRQSKADNIGISLLSLSRLIPKPKSAAVVSRNLYASFMLAVLKRQPIIFETHQLEFGFRRYLQYATMVQPHVVTVVISRCLLELLGQHHNRLPANPLILHDAAPANITPIIKESKRDAFRELFPDLELDPGKKTIGYFGHLYEGRGIGIIERLAERHPEAVFLVFGGNSTEVDSRRKNNGIPNVVYMGHVPHSIAQRTMAACDVLLMPYQEKVSIGVGGHDTARWMSPMKMFEYLASGTPVISSDLPPLREVLQDGINALTVSPSDYGQWSSALAQLLGNQELADRIGRTGHQTYAKNHTWDIRAKALLRAVSQ